MSPADAPASPASPDDDDPFSHLEPSSPARPPALAPFERPFPPPDDGSPTDPAREAPSQWSLAELFVVSTTAAVGAAIARWLHPPYFAALLGTGVILLALHLHLEDWEPRWQVVAWRSLLVAYLTVVFVSLFGP